jgi:competence protein ComFC
MIRSLDTLRNTFLPLNPCRICGDPVRHFSREYSRIPVCPACLTASRRLIPPRCTVCGRPLISEITVCTVCRERSYPFSEHRSLYEYRGSVKLLIRLFKFSQVPSLAPFFADRLAEELHTLIPRGDNRGTVVVPVPGNPASVRGRGWDQVKLISRYLVQNHGFTVSELLRRGRSKTQKSLGFDSRTKNLEGKIRVAAGSGAAGVPRDIILLDDVFTTGSTAAECTRVLLRAGAKRVRVLTLAID